MFNFVLATPVLNLINVFHINRSYGIRVNRNRILSFHTDCVDGQAYTQYNKSSGKNARNLEEVMRGAGEMANSN